LRSSNRGAPVVKILMDRLSLFVSFAFFLSFLASLPSAFVWRMVSFLFRFFSDRLLLRSLCFSSICFWSAFPHRQFFSFWKQEFILSDFRLGDRKHRRQWIRSGCVRRQWIRSHEINLINGELCERFVLIVIAPPQFIDPDSVITQRESIGGFPRGG
jgi:hypothetical protein